ncbi:glycosyltransferase [Marinobacter zhejiangensis]|uniref:Glycosyltransferase involved in cell wall bisynthesis n=1 Tax=Marinobacter zhejiangensis TaxID=488535 RepID=A0A1I4SCQ6_9GAMM|nr:glycosyltransferase [Marinobacter zhejiangensis]SFM62296.1 Glycosyltransferase involved in cell wall bisynthesis [Marinobacter zhejiangensis]
MKIAFILGGSTYEQSLYRVTFDVANELRTKGSEVDCVFWENPGALKGNDKFLPIFGLCKDRRRSKLFAKLFTAIFGKHGYYYIFSKLFSRQLNLALGQEGYDAIFFHGQSCIPMHAGIGNNYVIVHSCKYENFIARHRGLKKPFYRWLYQKIYSGKKLLTVSDDVANDMVHKIGARPRSIETIHNGFDFARLGREIAAPEPAGLPAAYLMAAGRPDRTKRFDLLIRAYAKTRKDYPLVIFGNGKLLGQLKELARQLQVSDHVIFPGFCPDILPAFRHAKLYVSSSDVEGLPTVIVESLIAGTPVVATDAGGSNELLAGELSRWIVPRGDVDALAKAIDDILLTPPSVSEKNVAFLDHRLIANQYLRYAEQVNE